MNALQYPPYGLNESVGGAPLNPKEAFERFTRETLQRGSKEEIEAWLLSFPLFATTAYPARELLYLWDTRYVLICQFFLKVLRSPVAQKS